MTVLLWRQNFWSNKRPVRGGGRLVWNIEMTQNGKRVVAVTLFVLGLATLGFTGCGLFFGIALLLNSGWQISWLGFVCAAIGLFVLRQIFRSLKELMPQFQAPGQKPPEDSVHRPEEPK